MKTHLNIAVAAAILAVLHFTAPAAEHEAAGTPAGNNTIVAVAAGNPDFGTLVTALRAAELTEALGGPGPFTVFAPNNAAFAKLPPGALEDLLKPENKKKLAGILKNHVVAGKVMAADVKSGNVKTLDGEKVEVVVENGKVGFGGAKVIATDIEASNGVIHVIDSVVLPD
jgi:uncharacterized surface protein with fasciclin (FAS1) repeats